MSGIGVNREPVNSSPVADSTSALLLKANGKRIFLSIYNPEAEDVYVAFGDDAVFGQGSLFVPAKGHLKIEIIEEKDTWACNSIYGITNGPTITLEATEVTLP